MQNYKMPTGLRNPSMERFIVIQKSDRPFAFTYSLMFIIPAAIMFTFGAIFMNIEAVIGSSLMAMIGLFILSLPFVARETKKDHEDFSKLNKACAELTVYLKNQHGFEIDIAEAKRLLAGKWIMPLGNDSQTMIWEADSNSFVVTTRNVTLTKTYLSSLDDLSSSQETREPSKLLPDKLFASSDS